MTLIADVQKSIAAYLTLTEVPTCARISKDYAPLACEILKKEAVYFGGTEQEAKAYLSKICAIVRHYNFPLRVVSNGWIKDQYIHIVRVRATLLKLRTISVANCSLIMEHERLAELIPLISLSSLDDDSCKPETLLSKALRKGVTRVAIRSLELATQKDIPPCYNLTSSILGKNPALVRLIIPHTLNINFTFRGSSPLFVAVEELCTSRARLKFLISKQSSDQMIIDKMNEEKIHIKNLEEILNLLLAAGAKDNVNRHNLAYPTAFSYCLIQSEFEVAQLLKSQGIGLASEGPGDKNYLHMAMIYQQDWMLVDEVSLHAIVNAQDILGNTPLHFAMLKKYRAGINFLLGMCASLNIRNKDGKTPINLFPDYDKEIP